MTRRILVLVASLFLISFIFVVNTTGRVEAATYSQQQSTLSLDIASQQKNCAVLEVFVEGTASQVVCAKPKSATAKISAQPDLGRDNNCSIPNDTVIVYNEDFEGVVCFYGGSGLYVTLYDVDAVEALDDTVFFTWNNGNNSASTSGNYCFDSCDDVWTGITVNYLQYLG